MCLCDTVPLLQDCAFQDIPRLTAWPEETAPEGEAARRPRCGPEEDGVVRATEEAIEEEEQEETVSMLINCGAVFMSVG